MLKEEARQSTDNASETWRTGRLTETGPEGRCPGSGAMGMSLSSASVEVMTTESGDDRTTSSVELTPLTCASKRGDALVCELHLNNLVFLKKKIRRVPPLCPSKRIQSCPPFGGKLTSQHKGRTVLHEPPLHRRRVCRTCSPETYNQLPRALFPKGEWKGAGGRSKVGHSSTSRSTAP